MTPTSWNTKRERQYAHIKEGLTEHGHPMREAEQIAARTVNKERARAGESATASPESVHDLSSGRRGGLRSHAGAKGPTKRQLYGEARRKNLKGRSKMTKRELARALSH